MKQTVVFDFDGVIHSYKSGWMGANIIPDPPVPGIGKAIADIREAGYEVVVVSARCATLGGYGAIRAWLMDNGIEVDGVKTEKPPAVAYIDDRAICFDGHPEKLLGRIKAFKPWNKSSETNADRIRSMSDIELARFLAEVEYRRAGFGGGAKWKGEDHALLWLQQPAEGTPIHGGFEDKTESGLLEED